MVERVPIDDLLAEEVAKLQKLIHGSPVPKVLLHAFEERNLVLVCCRCRRGWDGLRHNRCQGRLNGWAIGGQRLIVGELRLLRRWAPRSTVAYGRSLCGGHYGGRSLLIVPWTLLRLFACTRGRGKASQRWHFLTTGRARLRCLHDARGWGPVFAAATRGGLLSRVLRKELFEVFEKIWRGMEERGNLGVNVRDCLRFPLVGL